MPPKKVKDITKNNQTLVIVESPGKIKKIQQLIF